MDSEKYKEGDFWFGGLFQLPLPVLSVNEVLIPSVKNS